MGISENARYLDAIICPAAWKERREMAMSLTQFVGSSSGFGLTASVWARIAAPRRRRVWKVKERIIVSRRSGPSRREAETKQRLPRRKAPTAIKALAQRWSGLSGLSLAPRARRMMFPIHVR